jgi:hypothetical protein
VADTVAAANVTMARARVGAFAGARGEMHVPRVLLDAPTSIACGGHVGCCRQSELGVELSSVHVQHME